MEMILKSNTNSLEIEGISLGGGEIVINRIGKFFLNLQGNRDALIIIVRDKEKRAVLKRIKNLLRENLTNIETFQAK